MRKAPLPNPLNTDGIECLVHGDEQAVFGLCLNGGKDAIPGPSPCTVRVGDGDRQQDKIVGAGGSSSSSHAVPDHVRSCCCSTIGTEATAPKQRMTFARITVNPAQMEGVLGIRVSRIPIATVVGMVADSMSTPEILTPIQTSMGLLRKRGELFLNEEVFHAQSAETFYAAHSG
jgi:hypothetical protein